MSSYRYRALQRNGTMAEGSVAASSRNEAHRRLIEQGMQVLSLSDIAEKLPEKSRAKPSKQQAPVAPGSLSTSKVTLSSKQLIQFTEELSDLLSAGVPLDSALQSIMKRSENEDIRHVATVCHEQVRDGVPLSAALKAASPSFSELYCNLVSAGEVSGALGQILSRQVKYLTTLAELKSKLMTALIYPSFLVVSGVGVSAMFIFFLIPKLHRLVEATGGTLPPIARMMLGSGDLLVAYWPVLLVAMLAVLLGLGLLWNRPGFRLRLDQWQLRAPLFGRLFQMRFNVQFVETLANLLSNGLPLVKAMELLQGSTSNRYIHDKLNEVTDLLAEGASLHRCMEKTGVFESGLIDMVRIGEDTGHLVRSVSKAGDRLDRELSRSIERIANVIQPAIILVMAGMVGAMAYMMISVIYETISILRNH